MNTDKKIMIFDDDEDILSICNYILEEDGWQVRTFVNCEDIVTRVSDFLPDVIIMDNWIPHEGGVTATREIKAEPALAAIPVIYFSANSDIEQLAAAAGADEMLPKPFDLEALRSIVTNALDKCH